MAMQRFVGPLDEGAHRRCAAGGRFRAQPEQVGHRAVEVAGLAVDVEAFDQSGGVPPLELVFAQVRYLRADALPDRHTIQAEFQADAAHALALELQRPGVGDAARLQRPIDRLIGLVEAPAVDVGDDSRQRIARHGQSRRQEYHRPPAQTQPRGQPALPAPAAYCNGVLATAGIHVEHPLADWSRLCNTRQMRGSIIYS